MRIFTDINWIIEHVIFHTYTDIVIQVLKKSLILLHLIMSISPSPNVKAKALSTCVDTWDEIHEALGFSSDTMSVFFFKWHRPSAHQINTQQVDTSLYLACMEGNLPSLSSAAGRTLGSFSRVYGYIFVSDLRTLQ